VQDWPILNIPVGEMIQTYLGTCSLKTESPDGQGFSDLNFCVEHCMWMEAEQ